MFLVSFDRSEVPTHKERACLLLKLCFRVDFFRFSRLGVVSLNGQPHEKVGGIRPWDGSLGSN
jgi:hypothetical protein